MCRARGGLTDRLSRLIHTALLTGSGRKRGRYVLSDGAKQTTAGVVSGRFIWDGARAKTLMKNILLTFSLVLLAAIPCAAQTYIGAGIGGGYSTSDFDPKPIEFFGVAQKQSGRFHFRGLGGLRTESPLNTIFQEGATGFKQDGYEIFARPEVDFTFGKGVFVGVGGDYFYQVFPSEPGGKDNHYHSGLNPLVSAGLRFKARGNHRIAFTRIFQEFKIREFPYITAYKPGAHVKSLQHKGTLNPAYLEGWRLSHEYLKPISDHFSFYGAAEGTYYKLKEFPIKSFGDNYYEREAFIAFRIGLVYR
jgi:hypothetical protein